VSRATSMLGAPLAGLLVGLIGANGVLLIDAITFFIAVIGVQTLIPSALVAKESGEKASYLDDLREGFRFVRQDSLILTFIAVIMLTNMVDAAMASVTLPVFTRTLFGPENGAFNQGIIVAVFGGSALAGTLIYSWTLKRKFERRWLSR